MINNKYTFLAMGEQEQMLDMFCQKYHYINHVKIKY